MPKKCPNTPCICNFGGKCRKHEMEDDTVGSTPCQSITDAFDKDSEESKIISQICDQLICYVAANSNVKSMTIVVDDAHAQVILHSGSKAIGDWSTNGSVITITRK